MPFAPVYISLLYGSLILKNYGVEHVFIPTAKSIQGCCSCAYRF